MCVCVCVCQGEGLEEGGGGGEEVDPWRRGRQKCFGGQLGGSEINTAWSRDRESYILLGI